MVFFKKPCYFCKRKTKDVTTYLNENSKKIHVCAQCKGYAERRAYFRAK